jgi:hypothetical protein
VTDADGYYAHDFASSPGADYDVRGFDLLSLSWQWGDDMVIRRVTVEGVNVWIGRPRVVFGGHPGQPMVVELHDGTTDELIALAGGFLSDVGMTTKFTDAWGDTVRTLPGDRVVGDFAVDADFVLPDIGAAINKVTDRVTANCALPGIREITVRAWDPIDLAPNAQRYQLTDASGSFVANFAASPPANIKVGHKVEVSCRLDSGDWVSRQFTVE